MKEEKFPHSSKPSHGWVCGKFWNLREQNNQEKKKQKQKQKTRLTATPNREVAQMLTSTTSEQGLDKEVQAVCLG